MFTLTVSYCGPHGTSGVQYSRHITAARAAQLLADALARDEGHELDHIELVREES